MNTPTHIPPQTPSDMETQPPTPTLTPVPTEIKPPQKPRMSEIVREPHAGPPPPHPQTLPKPSKSHHLVATLALLLALANLPTAAWLFGKTRQNANALQQRASRMESRIDCTKTEIGKMLAAVTNTTTQITAEVDNKHNGAIEALKRILNEKVLPALDNKQNEEHLAEIQTAAQNTKTDLLKRIDQLTAKLSEANHSVTNATNKISEQQAQIDRMLEQLSILVQISKHHETSLRSLKSTVEPITNDKPSH